MRNIKVPHNLKTILKYNISVSVTESCILAMSKLLKFNGDSEFRQLIILSLLSGKPIIIENIRCDEDNLGLTDYQVALLKLIDEITNGTKTKLNETGTRLVFHPGFITGGEVVFDCGTERSLGYFMEVMTCLAAFSKQKFNLTLKGVTHGDSDPNVSKAVITLTSNPRTLQYILKN